MSLISDMHDLKDNTQALEKGRFSGSESEVQSYKSLVKKGRVFFPYLSEGGIAFGPSRFLGYKNNTLVGHLELEGRDGRVTNAKISQVLGEEFGVTFHNVVDQDIEAHFLRFCENIAVDPDRVQRTFWITPEVSEWLDANPIQANMPKSFKELELEIRNDSNLEQRTRRAMISARVGQGLFRRRVLNHYTKCMITGVDDPALLVASHIKPWRDCYTNPQECLSPKNALLLTPMWDAVFDKGYVSFSDEGTLLIGKRLSASDRKALGISVPTSLTLSADQVPFMRYHRELHGF